MFDFAWSEIAVIAAVALVLIGPKDMPVAIRTITGMIKKARRMAGEFQTHVDEMMREANLDDIKNSINEIRNFDLKDAVEKHIDPDGALRNTFAENPLEPTPVTAHPTGVIAEPDPAPVTDVAPVVIDAAPMPAFLPPTAVAPALPVPAPEAPEPPAFVPPDIAHSRNG
jgi:sec-independent protein translocase protein TatB